MAKEIERKFLVRNTKFLEGLTGKKITQGYITDNPMTIRVRIMDDEAFLTLKGKTSGLSRDEFEGNFTVADAEELMKGYCGHRIVSKTRYLVPVGEHTFEVDVFHGKLEGLIIAEVELLYEEEEFEKPDWLGTDVSLDFRFFNSALAEAHSVPVFHTELYDGFIFADTPGEELLAAVFMTGLTPRFWDNEVIRQVTARLAGRSGTMLVNMVLNNGSANNLFLMPVVDGKVLPKSTRIVEPSQYATFAKLSAKYFQKYPKSLNLKDIYDDGLRKAIRNGTIPAFDKN